MTHKEYSLAFQKLAFKDIRLEHYINLFLEHYSKIYESNNLYFTAEVIYSEYAIGIYFHTSNTKSNTHIIWRQGNIEDVMRVSGNQTLENLFIQKDVKGFEKKGFYIIKPNEYKNWHQAIGYLDLYEFQDAMIKAGK